jgi:dienelactone hydrolase
VQRRVQRVIGRAPRTARLLAAAAIALLAIAGPIFAATAVPEHVSFDSFDIDPATGQPIRLLALRYVPAPDVATKGAVVALHGCGGIYSNVKGREALPSRRHQAMAEMLVDEGYVVVFPDSFNSRGERELCTKPFDGRAITQVQRRLDALAALAWLQAQPDIAPDRVALLGWSNGGGTVLATDNARQAVVAEFRRTHPAPYFATAIAFYPSCVAYTRPETYRAAAPLQIFIGASDDWTPAAPCVALGAAAAARNVALMVKVYPDSYHEFDAPGGRLQVRSNVPNGVHPGQGVTVAPNPEARADAYARVREILRNSIGRPASPTASSAASSTTSPAPPHRPAVRYFTP